MKSNKKKPSIRQNTHHDRNYGSKGTADDNSITIKKEYKKKEIVLDTFCKNLE